MPLPLTTLSDVSFDAFRRARSLLSDLATPTLRLGVTGLAQAGKTIFITALVRNLVEGGRLPFLEAYAQGRVRRAYLEPQPDDAVPRFDYEAHLATLGSKPPAWPDSTRQISQLRVTIEFEPVGVLRRATRPGRLHLDIVDYPGEWLLDLALLDQSFEEFSRQALALARAPRRAGVARVWLERLAALDPSAPADEATAIDAAGVYTAYARAARSPNPALATIGPGRFLLPGDLAGSPLVTFAPLDLPSGWTPPRGSLAAMMERRFESYKSLAVRPFFRDHFSRLDRQVVLVDALSALNDGAEAIDDLTHALAGCLQAFRPGTGSWLDVLLGRRIDKVLFAATKADLLAQANHDRLESVLRHVTQQAATRARASGADIGVLALAAVRATREAERRQNEHRLACIVGTPMPGQRLGTTVFDGVAEAAIFPGDLPDDIGRTLAEQHAAAAIPDLRFIRFRPPTGLSDRSPGGAAQAWPHVRLDRALEFLLGDRLA